MRAADFLTSRAFALNGKAPCYFYGEWIWLAMQCWTSLYLRYEANTAQAIRNNLRRGEVFWDVGANYGLFSLFAARIVGRTGNVVSFEPSPAAFALLEKNVKAIKSVLALPYGIGNENGKAMMSVQGVSTGSSFVREVVELSQIYHEDVPIAQVPVSIYKLDKLLDQIDRPPNLVKIDIEGFEVNALRGAESLLSQVRPRLIIEIHPLQLGMSGSREEEIFEVLRRHDYSHEVFNRDQQWALYSIIAKPRR